jgi:hypothetical protein
MQKETVLNNIAKAKQSHLAQVEKIDCLVRGISITEKPTPIGQRECFFGKWLYGDEAVLRKLILNQHFDEIERLHSIWHEEYYEIYKIFYPENQGFLSKVIGKKHKASLQARDRGKAYFVDLQQITEQLLRKIDVIEKRVQALPEKKFAELG